VIAFKITTHTFRGVGDGRKPMKPASVHNGNVIPHSNIPFLKDKATNITNISTLT